MKRIIATIAFLSLFLTGYSQPDCTLIKKQNDSLRAKIAVLNYKIGRVNHFCGVVDKNPKDIKFLKGWVKRAIQ